MSPIDRKLYFAYGSNMNDEQMAFRCPDAEAVGTVRLEGYICAADISLRQLRNYCRKVYELGYVPICPKLSDTQYLTLDSADEKREFQNIARQKLGRCRMLVVCGNEFSALMSTEIGMAEKRNIICTTLDGLIRIKESGGDREL